MLSRLFQMVYLLMEKSQMTAKELAEIFEVSERTIYRDIDKLTMLLHLNGSKMPYWDIFIWKSFIPEISREMAFRAYEELSNIVVTDNGTLLCKIEVSDIPWFTGYVLSYGSNIRVLEPVEIKEKVKQEIEKMKDLYTG